MRRVWRSDHVGSVRTTRRPAAQSSTPSTNSVATNPSAERDGARCSQVCRTRTNGRAHRSRSFTAVPVSVNDQSGSTEPTAQANVGARHAVSAFTTVICTPERIARRRDRRAHPWRERCTRPATRRSSRPHALVDGARTALRVEVDHHVHEQHEHDEGNAVATTYCRVANPIPRGHAMSWP